MTRSHTTHGTSTIKKKKNVMIINKETSAILIPKPNLHFNKGEEWLDFGLLINRGAGKNFWSIRQLQSRAGITFTEILRLPTPTRGR